VSILETNLVVALAAFVVEAAFGYPHAIFRIIRHPVVWIGALIAGLEQSWNKASSAAATRRRRGYFAMILILAVVGVLTIPLTVFLSGHSWGWIVEALLAASLLAGRSLYQHVQPVLKALGSENKDLARTNLGKIVGRETNNLDKCGISRAAIESLAESFSDGVVAPLFWLTVGGLPGAALYKAINTADSMIGHRSERYLDFGRAAARLDDLVNFIPARLSALLIASAALFLPAARPRAALRAAVRDAGAHASPNAGWPEAAMAGALAIKLGGPRVYAGREIKGAWLGSGRAEASATDIRRALRLYIVADVMLAFLLIAALAVSIH
jgi:adenosylcobinamide-phosphate synthase